MTEHIVEDPYWQQHVKVGEVSLHPRDGLHQLYLQVHMSEEQYGSEMERELGVRLSEPRGVRAYVHARPSILVPRIMLTVALSDDAEVASSAKAVGEVVESRLEGMERWQLGTAQAWYYPSDHILVLWECNIHYPHRPASDDPTEDTLLALAWQSFERLLLDKFPNTERIVTPGWEPAYESEKFQAFLRGRGYAPEADYPRAFSRNLQKS